jgi:hypothetical protein
MRHTRMCSGSGSIAPLWRLLSLASVMKVNHGRHTMKAVNAARASPLKATRPENAMKAKKVHYGKRAMMAMTKASPMKAMRSENTMKAMKVNYSKHAMAMSAMKASPMKAMRSETAMVAMKVNDKHATKTKAMRSTKAMNVMTVNYGRRAMTVESSPRWLQRQLTPGRIVLASDPLWPYVNNMKGLI